METTCKSVLPSRFICAFAVVVLAVGGCRAPTAEARTGVATYVRGDLQASLPNDFNPILAATHHAITELGFTEISAKEEGLSAVVLARAPSGRKIEISVASAGKGLTDIKIRVDLFGDEQLSCVLLDKIKAAR